MSVGHIILIEPDRVLAAIYRRALMENGFSVTPCASAQAAIFACDQQKPDLIFLEPQLIDHSGIEFLYELRSYPDWQEIPVVLHTQIPPAEFNSHIQLLKQNLGVQKYLYKTSTNLSHLISTAKEFTSVVA